MQPRTLRWAALPSLRGSSCPHSPWLLPTAQPGRGQCPLAVPHVSSHFHGPDPTNVFLPYSHHHDAAQPCTSDPNLGLGTAGTWHGPIWGRGRWDEPVRWHIPSLVPCHLSLTSAEPLGIAGIHGSHHKVTAPRGDHLPGRRAALPAPHRPDTPSLTALTPIPLPNAGWDPR